ncbi:acyltransferase domain-containing protein [Sphaerisporangium sp. NPDC051017]|uniref:type I polyketide synthase n=1 Tax=Sphaerisporangium sp. NPDC051017 TaxID=3154636 RepID=UPI003420DEA9
MNSTPSPREPIAIVGAACRLPGASSVPAFWDVLVGECDTVGEIPVERFASSDTTQATAQWWNRIPARAGGFLQDIDQFDASYFTISPHEAVRIDPQHRLLIEVTAEAIDDAGISQQGLAGSRTAVFTSCLPSDYWDILRRAGLYDMHAAVGAGNWGTLAGRISYLFDLRGPSMGMEATCSTSLLSVHLACRELWSGNSTLAIVGGVNLLLAPDLYLSLADAGVLSPSGRCRFGDAGADGYVRSEAAVSIVLKPLSRALADGDQLYATIIGSAVNSNGRGSGTLIAAGVDGQEAMLRDAYEDAGVAPGQVAYVEAHGPGTPRGDLTELDALGRVMGEGREPGHTCLVGSAKSNVGHGEGVSGLIGLVKAALALKHKIIPATLHVKQPHALFDEPGMPLRPARRTQPWPDRPGPAVAGVSSFGLSATNAHIVLAEAPAVVEAPRRKPSSTPFLLPLSARDSQALPEMALRYADALDAPGTDLYDICHSAGARRSHHELRLAVVGGGHKVAASLRAFGAGASPQSVVGGSYRASGPSRVVFVFPGQGSQWVGMGRELMDQNRVFARRMRECDRAIKAELGWSVIDRLGEDTPLTATSEVQPALWAVQVSLAAVWQDWGVTPDLLIGHSMGEVAAATVSGALTVRQGAAVICRRSVLLDGLSGSGAMWVVHLDEERALEAIGERSGQVCVGVVNSSRSCVLAGDPDAMAEVIGPLRDQGVFCRQVQVDYASHAPQVEPVRPALLDALSSLRPRAGAVPLHSTLLDRVIDGSVLDGDYWMENLRRPVRFASAIRAVLADDTPTLFVEISPHPLLSAVIEDEIAISGADATAVPSLHREEPEQESLLHGLAHAYVRGCDPAWERIYPGGRYVPLPSYAWQRKRFWVDPPADTRPAPVAEPDFVEPARADAPYDGADLATSSPEAFSQYLMLRFAEFLGLPPDQLDPEVPLTLHGLDSVLAAKLSARVKTDLAVEVRIGELLSPRPLGRLAGELYETVTAVPVERT